MKKLIILIVFILLFPVVSHADCTVVVGGVAASGCTEDTAYVSCETTWSDMNLDQANAAVQSFTGNGDTLYSISVFLNDEGTDGTIELRLCNNPDCTGANILESWTGGQTITGGGAAWYEYVSVSNPTLTNSATLYIMMMEEGAYDISWEMVNSDCDGLSGQQHECTGGSGDWEVDFSDNTARDYNYRVKPCQ